MDSPPTTKKPSYIALMSICLSFDPSDEDLEKGAKNLSKDDDNEEADSESDVMDDVYSEEYYFDFGTEENELDYGGYDYEAILDFLQSHLPVGYYYDGDGIEMVSGPHERALLKPNTLVISLPSLKDVPKFDVFNMK